MGLDYGYDAIKGKWYARGFQFLRLYNTKEEMKADAHNAEHEYFNKRRNFKAFAMSFAQLRYAR